VRMKFEAPTPDRKFFATLYLAPDGKHVSTDLFDSTTDPVAAEKSANHETLIALTAGSHPSLGPADAPVTLVIFSDFECPYCRNLSQYLKSEMTPDSKEIRVVFHNFPLHMHPWAKPAAEYAMCAARQGNDNFWKFHDFFFHNQKALNRDRLDEKALEFAGSVEGLDMDAFKKCVDNHAAADAIRDDVDLATANHVKGTPTVFVNGRATTAIRNQQDLHDAIAEALGAAAESHESSPSINAAAKADAAAKP